MTGARQVATPGVTVSRANSGRAPGITARRVCGAMLNILHLEAPMIRGALALLSTVGLGLVAMGCDRQDVSPLVPNTAVAVVTTPVTDAWPITDLGTMGRAFSGATDINNLGNVAGYVADGGGAEPHAMFWSSGTGMLDLGVLGGAANNSAVAHALNDANEVVGESDPDLNLFIGRRAFVWSAASGMIALPSDSGVDAAAWDVTNAHVIIGCGGTGGTGVSQVLRWDPNGSGGWTVTGLGNPPGGAGSSCATGLGGANNAVGLFPLSGGDPTGFLLTNGSYRTLSAGTKATRLVASRFVGASGINNFIGVPTEWPSLSASASPFSLGWLYIRGGEARDLNAANHIVGTMAGVSGTIPAFTRPFYWDCATGLSDLGSLGGAFADVSEAAAINSHDQVAGTSNNHAVIWGVTPGPGVVVPLPFAGTCGIPPVVGYIPKKFINDGILSRPGFDATLIDPNTVTISDGFGHVTPIARRQKPPGPPTFQVKDLNGDGLLDLQVSFSKAQMIADGTLTPQSFQLVVSWMDPTGLPQSGKYPIRVQ